MISFQFHTIASIFIAAVHSAFASNHLIPELPN